MTMTAVEGERATGAPTDDPEIPGSTGDAATSEVVDDTAVPEVESRVGDEVPAPEIAPPGDVPDEPPSVTAEETGEPPTGDAAPAAPQSEAPPSDAPPSDARPATAPSSEVPPAQRPPRRRGRLVLAAALLAVLSAVLGGVVGGLVVLHDRPAAAAPPPPAAAPNGLVDAVGTVLPAVFRIQAGAPDTGTAGTAVVLTSTGDVVTNEHLVHGETTATLIAPDGRKSTARVMASDEKADVAWLRIDGATNLPVAHLAAPGTVRLGEDVVAIGNALNLDGAPSITRGVVSAVGRSTATLDDVIQTDAAISSGSSGGALVDRTGTVVGITTEALVGDPSVSVEDIAFAIPSDRVEAVLAGMGLALPPR
jgi:putative serine protease PepD